MDDDMTETPSPNPPPAPAAADSRPGRRRGLQLALGLSVALNLVLLGLIAGGLARGHSGRMGPSDAGLGPLASALTPEDRKAMREGFLRMGQNWRAYRQAAAEDARALAAIIATEPFDRAAAQAVLDRQTQSVGQRMQASQSLLLDRIAALSPAERQAFAARLTKALDQRKGGN